MSKSWKVFVDVDETQVKTRLLAPDEQPKPGYRLVEVRLGDRLVRAATRARPSARPFLEALRDRCQLNVLTSGGVVFQSAILQELDLLEFFEHVYGGDNLDSLAVPTEPWVLVDDLPLSASGLETKLGRLGHDARKLKAPCGERTRGADGNLWEGERWQQVLDRHFVRCALYFGEEDHEPLTGLIDEVVRKLTGQRT